MRTIQETLYTFDELSDPAKERAREWWREASSSDEWWDGVYEDAKRAAVIITSFDLDRGDIDGEFEEDALATAHYIRTDHGQDCETYKTAAAFLQDRDKLIDEWPRDEDGEFDDERELDAKLDDLEAEFLRSILEDYRIILRKEIEYQMADEQVDENIRCNEYEFTEDGKIY